MARIELSLFVAAPPDRCFDLSRSVDTSSSNSFRLAIGDEMDLTVPYTFYPSVLPHWMAWTLFLIAMLGGVAVGVAQARRRGVLIGLIAGALGIVGFLAVTMVASMVIAFFVHDL